MVASQSPANMQNNKPEGKDSKTEVVKDTATVASQTDPYLSFLSNSEWCDGDLQSLSSFLEDPAMWGSMTDIENLACDANFDDAISTTDDVIANLLQLNNYDIEYEVSGDVRQYTIGLIFSATPFCFNKHKRNHILHQF